MVVWEAYTQCARGLPRPPLGPCSQQGPSSFLLQVSCRFTTGQDSLCSTLPSYGFGAFGPIADSSSSMTFSNAETG